MFRLTPYNRNQMIRGNDNVPEFYNLFDDFLNDSMFTSRSLGTGSFKIDIKDNEDNFVIEAELPGVKRENISIDFKDEQLIIKVEALEQEEVKEEGQEAAPRYVHKERRQSSMQRVFRMKGIKRDELSAKLEDGILTVIAPKLDEVANTYKVEIK